jgi:hypothetical protein
MRIYILFLLLIVSSVAHSQLTYAPQTGDLLFQDLDCGDFCDAIEKVTVSANDKSFSHVGIVSVENESVYVLEAGGRGVVKTPLDSFLNRSSDSGNHPKVVAGRMKESFRHTIPEAIEKAKSLLGKKYDGAFDIGNDQYYCSELVYFAFWDSSGKSLFNLYPMTFIDPETHKTFPAWVNYFKESGIIIPEGKPGLNPGGISQSDKIEIIFSYY